MRYFGPQIDIHMGGVDLVFPHHQNEIAQTEAFTGKTFAKYWMHAGHLLVDGKKMAKSAGNFYTLRDIYQHFPQHTHQQVARAFRLLCLTSQYRENTNFTFASLTAAINTLNGLDAVLDRLAHLPRIE
jgi:cysteinyl-tRNA synthetase